jgi:hypothetical protein
MSLKRTVTIGEPYLTYDSIPSEALVIIHIPMEYGTID